MLLAAAIAISAGAFTLSACSDNGNDTTGDIDIVVAPASITIVQGASAAAAVTIDRSGTFAGGVGLAVSGQPASVDAVFAPASLGAGESTAAITVSAAADAVPGTYPLTLTASGSGVSDDTATLTVTITAAPVGVRQ
jgi:uncharacterized membrane protein